VIIEPDEAIPILRALGQAGIHGLDVERSADGRTYIPHITPPIEVGQTPPPVAGEAALELDGEGEYEQQEGAEEGRE
jgi:hypothetical protein